MMHHQTNFQRIVKINDFGSKSCTACIVRYLILSVRIELVIELPLLLYELPMMTVGNGKSEYFESARGHGFCAVTVFARHWHPPLLQDDWNSLEKVA